MGSVLQAGLWGLVGGSALVLGAVLGLLRRWPRRAIAAVMAFGSGVLISSVAYDLVEESWRQAGGSVTTLAMAAGAVVFFGCDLAVSRAGAPRRRRSTAASSGTAAAVIMAGALLDGIPESAAIGATLLDAGTVSVSFLVAVLLSNIPESLSSSAGMLASGRSRRAVLGLWVGVALVAGIAAAAGYLLIAHSPGELVGGINSFAAGAVLTMVASTMLPEAHDEGGAWTALLTTAGFLTAVALSQAGG